MGLNYLRRWTPLKLFRLLLGGSLVIGDWHHLNFRLLPLEMEAGLLCQSWEPLSPYKCQLHPGFHGQFTPARLGALIEGFVFASGGLALSTAALDNIYSAALISECREKLDGCCISQMAEHPLDQDGAVFITSEVHLCSISPYIVDAPLLICPCTHLDVGESDLLILAADDAKDFTGVLATAQLKELALVPFS